ncbi:MAG: hypothetical protein WC829_16855 [Hyphomicrobium sp.]|jgi:hypothetical protein
MSSYGSDKGRPIMEALGKPLLAGAIGAGVAYAYYGVTDSALVFGMEIPAWAIAGAAVAVGNYAAELAHVAVLEQIPKLSDNEQIQMAITAGVAVGTSGIATFAILKLLGVGGDIMPALIVGGSGTIAGDYMWNKFISPTKL